jgi:hypothetical protein
MLFAVVLGFKLYFEINSEFNTLSEGGGSDVGIWP